MLTGAPVSTAAAKPVPPRSRRSYVLGIAAVTAIGGFLFGDDWVVIGGAKPFYETYFDLYHRRANRVGQQMLTGRLLLRCACRWFARATHRP